MKINVILKEEFGGLYEFKDVKDYVIDTKTGFLIIYYEYEKTIFIKLKEIVYFRIFW